MTERALSGVYLSPSEVDGIPSRLLVTGSLQQTLSYQPGRPVSDLYVIPFPGQSSAPERLEGMTPVMKAFVADSLDAINPTIATDSLGRLVALQVSSQRIPYNVLRVDIATGTLELLGATSAHGLTSRQTSFYFSPARTVVCVYDVFGLEGGPREIAESCDRVQFVGEALYYVYDRWRLSSRSGNVCGAVEGFCRLRSDGTSELVFASPKPTALQAIQGSDAHKLLLSTTTVTGETAFSLLDADTLVITPLPSATTGMAFYSTSPDGHWLLFGDRTVVLYNWSTGNLVTVDPDLLAVDMDASQAAWRPGHNELWINGLYEGEFAVLKLEGDPVTPGAPVDLHVDLFRGHRGQFTPDGRHWFASEGGGFGDVAYVGSADHPDAPLFPINPQSAQTYAIRQVSNGRLLVEAGAISDTSLPKDLYLLDPDTGDSRALCSGCKMAALGQTRALLLLNWALAQGTGDLTLVDLDTFAQTLLAESVHAVAVDRGKSADVPPGTHALAPETQVAFLVRNRLVAPYDGLWVAKLP